VSSADVKIEGKKTKWTFPSLRFKAEQAALILTPLKKSLVSLLQNTALGLRNRRENFPVISPSCAFTARAQSLKFQK